MATHENSRFETQGVTWEIAIGIDRHARGTCGRAATPARRASGNPHIFSPSLCAKLLDCDTKPHLQRRFREGSMDIVIRLLLPKAAGWRQA